MLSRVSKVCINLKNRGSPVLLRTGQLQVRSLHISPKWGSNLTKHHRSVLESVNLVRFASTVTLKDLPPIPDAPPIPLIDESSSAAETLINQLAANGEASMASYGLGGWTPPGMVQQFMEFLHCTMDIPWWGSVAILTVCIRVLLFPLVILAQRNAAVMNNNMPQMQVIELKMSEARETGNKLDSARYAQEMMQFMQEKGLNPLKNMMVPLMQGPIFVSVFMGLRQMANVPVESMTTGGLSWFTDFTVSDPFYLLPVITSCTLYATLALGTDTAKLSAQNDIIRYVLRAMPLLVLGFSLNFPAVILWYWTCSNFISLGQVAFLRVPKVRDYFKIPRLITFSPDALPKKPKKFVEGVKDSWTNVKITNELQNRQRIDEIKFAKAGKGALVKTYKYDPTKPSPQMASKKS